MDSRHQEVLIVTIIIPVSPYLQISLNNPHKGLICKDLYINRWMLIHSGNMMIDMQPLNYGQKLRRDQLARAGFFYTGEGDKVICPWCNVCLNEWEAFDLAIEEHKRHSLYCDFILMLFPMLQ